MVKFVKSVTPYFLCSSTSLLISIVLSRIFNFALINTWQAGIVLAFVAGPYCVFAWRLATKYKVKHPIINFLVKVWITTWLLGWGVALLYFAFAVW